MLLLINSCGDDNELNMSNNSLILIKVDYLTYNFEGYYEIPINEIDYSNWKGDLNTIQERVDGKRQIWIQDPQGYWIEINDIHSKPNL